MKKLLFTLCLVLWSVVVMATPAKYPSTPIFILDQQGRPIPKARASITDLSGNPVVVYNDINGASVFTGQVPANGLLQFYADPNYYRVTVSGSGITYLYYTQCQSIDGGGGGGGGNPNLPLVSIDLTADTFKPATNPANDAVCPADGKPCFINFDKTPTGAQVNTADWIMPSFPLTPTGFLLSFTAPASASTIKWQLDWCRYRDNQDQPCVPNGSNLQTFTTTPAASGRRKDVTISPGDWPTTWVENAHVVISISRDYGGDTLNGTVRFENFRLEFTK